LAGLAWIAARSSTFAHAHQASRAAAPSVELKTLTIFHGSWCQRSIMWIVLQSSRRRIDFIRQTTPR
jgi:hypothetical protein